MRLTCKRCPFRLLAVIIPFWGSAPPHAAQHAFRGGPAEGRGCCWNT